MLNRTNRTFSANLNGLNLGTRSFVVKASASNGNATPRILHAHQRLMRDGTMITGDPMIRPTSRIAPSWYPCSSLGSSWPVSLAAKVVPVVAQSQGLHMETAIARLLSSLKQDLSPVKSKRGGRSKTRLAVRPFASSRLETNQVFRPGIRADRQPHGGRASSGVCLAKAPAAARG